MVIRIFLQCPVLISINSGDLTQITDLPLILILSVYTDFFTLRIWQKNRFSSLKFGKIQIFSGMRKGHLFIFFSHTHFFNKILIFFVIYTDFVLDQSGRSEINMVLLLLVGRRCPQHQWSEFVPVQHGSHPSPGELRLQTGARWTFTRKVGQMIEIFHVLW